MDGFFEPDPAGRQTAAIDPLGNTHATLHDEAGNAIAELECASHACAFSSGRSHASARPCGPADNGHRPSLSNRPTTHPPEG